jgi:putative ABC transport system permease protein
LGRVRLIGHLAVRDLRRRPGEAALLLLAIAAASATLTLGLALRGVTADPYQRTRAATAGPDLVAGPRTAVSSDEPPDTAAEIADLDALAHEPGVVAHSGPHPVVLAALEVNGRRGAAFAVGRDTGASPVDQPALTEGRWITDGTVVVEAAFADALGVGAGDHVTMNGRRFRVAGIAITAATPPYPEIDCFVVACFERTGMVWMTEADVMGLPPGTPLPDGPRESPPGHVLYLKLADPAAAREFATAHDVGDQYGMAWGTAWQELRDQTDALVSNERRVLVIGSRLIGLLAVASVAVLVGGRMADQRRRLGLLKAVGGTPGLAAAVLLAEYILVTVLATAAGLTTGWLAAPMVTDPSIGLLGGAGAPPFTLSTVVQVAAVALGIAVVATLVPAIRSSRTSTVRALANAARPPRRSARVIALSARLPAPFLLALRIAARRPRRVALSIASVFVTVSGIVAALGAYAARHVDQVDGFELPGSRYAQVSEALLVITVTLVALAAINAVFITSATVIDNRHASALARALGATPRAVTAGLSAAQVLPGLAGALLGIPGGLALLAAVDPDRVTFPPAWQLAAVVLGAALLLAALTAVPARAGARRPVAASLGSE